MVRSVALPLIALSTSPSHNQQEIRETPETPPSSNTAEPSQPTPNLAPNNEQESGLAIPATGTKNNPRAVPGLCEILLDEDRDMYSRESAAHALGQISILQARDALKKVLASNSNRRLKIAVQNALAAGMHRQPRTPDDGEEYERKPRTEPSDSPSEEPWE